MNATTRTRYSVTVNGTLQERTYASKAAAINAGNRIADEIMDAHGDDVPRTSITIDTLKGKNVWVIAFGSDPAPEPRTSVVVNELDGFTITEIAVIRARSAGNGEMCNWCNDESEHSIRINGWTDYVCTEHAHEWFAPHFTLPYAPSHCPDVLRGCSHVMVMDENGYSVACG